MKGRMGEGRIEKRKIQSQDERMWERNRKEMRRGKTGRGREEGRGGKWFR